MPSSAKFSTILVITLGALVFAATATAANPKLSPERPGKVTIEYVPPENPAHQALYELLKKRQVLENMQRVLSPFKLNFSITVRLKGCKGVRNAWYDDEDHTVTVCYEYLQDVMDHAPAETTPAGITPEDAIIGPTAEVFLHEFGHMLFDQYHMPLLGPEEDSADAVAIYTMMQFGPKFSRAAIGGVAYMYARKAKEQEKTFEKEDLAEEHPLTQARFYTLLCFAYGGQPKNFAMVVDQGYLPKWRAENCDGDYERIKYAVQTLFGPHIDKAKAKQVRAYFEKKFATLGEQPAGK
jgi:Putative metallopeptidase